MPPAGELVQPDLTLLFTRDPSSAALARANEGNGKSNGNGNGNGQRAPDAAYLAVLQDLYRQKMAEAPGRYQEISYTTPTAQTAQLRRAVDVIDSLAADQKNAPT